MNNCSEDYNQISNIYDIIIIYIYIYLLRFCLENNIDDEQYFNITIEPYEHNAAENNFIVSLI